MSINRDIIIKGLNVSFFIFSINVRVQNTLSIIQICIGRNMNVCYSELNGLHTFESDIPTGRSVIWLNSRSKSKLKNTFKRGTSRWTSITLKWRHAKRKWRVNKYQVWTRPTKTKFILKSSLTSSERCQTRFQETLGNRVQVHKPTLGSIYHLQSQPFSAQYSPQWLKFGLLKAVNGGLPASGPISSCTLLSYCK